MIKKNILIIDDNKDSLKLILFILEKVGFNCLTAMDGEAGLQKIRETIPDLVICDIQLPILNGVEVIALVKKDEKLKKIPIIALTSYAMIGDREKFLSAGFDGYISKPIDLTNFVAQIKAHLINKS